LPGIVTHLNSSDFEIGQWFWRTGVDLKPLRGTRRNCGRRTSRAYDRSLLFDKSRQLADMVDVFVRHQDRVYLIEPETKR
jgi:hypothetical protein